MIRTCLNTRKTIYSKHLAGFALPTILIASIIMLSVLLVSVTSTVATRVAIMGQTYNQMAQTAGDAGLAYANACLSANGGVPLWTNDKPLTPSTDCTGTQLAGFTCPAGSVDTRCAVTVNGGATAQVLVVGGGGGGGGTYHGAGGGGGGYIYLSSIAIAAHEYTVTVGGGGAGGANLASDSTGSNGFNSVFEYLTAIGGGGGGSGGNAAGVESGKTGGSGGGEGNYDAASGGHGLGVINQGFDGGHNGGGVPNYGSGGGGGAGGLGGNATTTTGGNGGVGLGNSISGVSVIYAGGGGGSTYNGGTPGISTGGGSAGAWGTAVAAPDNRGGGGGGSEGRGGGTGIGGKGGSGIVIISYPTGSITATITGAGNITTTSGGNTIHKFLNSGIFNVTATTANTSPVISTFSVGLPTTIGGAANEIYSVGSTKLLRSSTGVTWRTYTQSSRSTIPYVAIPTTGIGLITGTTTVGSILTAGALTPSGATATYQWQRSDAPNGTYTSISGATASTYTLMAGDIGKYIKVVATGSGYYSGVQTSTASSIISAISLTGIGVISGTTAVDSVLTAGAITPSGATVTYQWQSATTVGGTYANISSATANAYTLQSTDLGKYIKVVVTGSGSYTGTLTSSATTTAVISPIAVNGIVLNLDAGNIASYPGTGTTWTDLSGSGNNGTLLNGTSYSAANGGALSFNGTNQYVSVPHSSQWNFNGYFSICSWVNYSATNVNWWLNAIVGHDLGPTTVNKWIFSYDPSAGTLFHINGGANATINSTSWSPTLGGWYNLCMTRSSSTFVMYRNGVSNGTTTNSVIDQSATTPLTIGTAEGTSGMFNGKISSISIYNRALTPAEITQNFNALRGRYGL